MQGLKKFFFLDEIDELFNRDIEGNTMTFSDPDYYRSMSPEDIMEAKEDILSIEGGVEAFADYLRLYYFDDSKFDMTFLDPGNEKTPPTEGLGKYDLSYFHPFPMSFFEEIFKDNIELILNIEKNKERILKDSFIKKYISKLDRTPELKAISSLEGVKLSYSLDFFMKFYFDAKNKDMMVIMFNAGYSPEQLKKIYLKGKFGTKQKTIFIQHMFLLYNKLTTYSKKQIVMSYIMEFLDYLRIK